MPLGKGAVVAQGDALSIITYGMGVHWALEAVEALGLEGRVEIFNMRTLVPLDIEGIKSVCKTARSSCSKRMAVGGYGEHVVSILSKECWDQLDGPITQWLLMRHRCRSTKLWRKAIWPRASFRRPLKNSCSIKALPPR